MPKGKKQTKEVQIVQLEKYDELIEEIQSIKKLLILLFVKLGSESDEIASTLGIGSSTVRTMVPIRSVKKLPIGKE